MEKLTQLTNELIDWLNQECPAVAPPLEPYSTFDLSHDFCDGLRLRLDAIEQRRQIIAARMKTTTAEGILHDTAKRSGFRVDELKSKYRGVGVVKFRYFYFKRAKEMTNASLTQIGLLVGRNHSTVLHGIDKVDNEKLPHTTLLDEYNKFWSDEQKPEIITKVLCEPAPIINRPVRREFETSGFMAFNGYKEHQI